MSNDKRACSLATYYSPLTIFSVLLKVLALFFGFPKKRFL